MRDIDLRWYNCRNEDKINLFYQNPFVYSILFCYNVFGIRFNSLPTEYLFRYDFEQFSYKVTLKQACFEMHGFSLSNFRWCLSNEVDSWIKENIKGLCVTHTEALKPHGTVFFSNEEDAILFKLVWG